MRILRAAMQPAIPWKNGGGSTREIARFPATASLDAFDWRVSRARVASDGPFSRFENVDRTLLVLTGEGIRLAVEGIGDVILARDSEPFGFAGDVAVHAALVRGPIEDLNVMSRRERSRHRVSRRKIMQPETLRARGEALVVVVERGELEVDETVLVAEDALVAERGGAFAVGSSSGADVVIVELESMP